MVPAVAGKAEWAGLSCILLSGPQDKIPQLLLQPLWKEIGPTTLEGSSHSRGTGSQYRWCELRAGLPGSGGCRSSRGVYNPRIR